MKIPVIFLISLAILLVMDQTRCKREGEIPALSRDAVDASANEHSPILTGGGVIPDPGVQTDRFNFTVTYVDLDNSTPVYVVLTLNHTDITMDKANPFDVDYSDGCTYKKELYLQPGSYNYVFSCSDEDFTNTTIERQVVVDPVNLWQPTLTAGSCTPGFGYNDSTEFTFRVTYTDPDNNQPAFVAVAIDGTGHPMVQYDEADTNYMDGKTYQFTTLLGPGNYTHYYNCSDGMNVVWTSAIAGPAVNSSTCWATVDLSGVVVGIVLSYNPFNFNTRYGHIVSDLRARHATVINLTGSITGEKLSGVNVIWIDGSGSGMPVADSVAIIDWIQAGGRLFISDDGSASVSPILQHYDLAYYFYPPMFSDYTADISPHPVTMNVESVYIPRNDYPYYVGTTAAQPKLISLVRSESRLYVAALEDGPGRVVINTCYQSLHDYTRAENELLVNNTFGWLGYRPVSTAPDLIDPGVTPSGGNQSQLYSFRVTYQDADGDPPAYVLVTINGSKHLMYKENTSDDVYLDGCTYAYQAYLQPATYIFFFNCSDWVNSISTGLASLVVEHSNEHVPLLISPSCTPSTGHNGTTQFTFSVMYTDLDNNIYTSLTLSLTRLAFFNEPITTSHAMVPSDPADANYVDGAGFTFSIVIELVDNYTYTFTCSDGYFSSTTGPHTGPHVLEFPVKNYWLQENYPYSWADASGGASFTSGFIKYSLSFDYTFYDMTFNSVYVSSRGYITFNNVQSSSVSIPQSTCQYMVAAYYQDFWTAQSVMVKNLTSPDRFVVTWVNLGTAFDFQVVLYRTGEIVLNYRDKNLIGGSFAAGLNYGPTTRIYNRHVVSSSTFSTYSVMYWRRPTSTHPDDVYCTVGETGRNVTWSLHSWYDGGTYEIFRNGSTVTPSTSWAGGATIVQPIDTSGPSRLWLYQIYFWDGKGIYFEVDDVLVIVNDIPTIIVQPGLNNTSLSRNGSYSTTFTIQDSVPGNGWYQVLINGTPYSDWQEWNGGIPCLLPINTTRGPGLFVYTITCRDSFGEQGIGVTILVRIIDCPLSTNPPDLLVVLGEARSITWVIQDQVGPGYYRVSCNGTSITPWYPWIDTEPFSIEINTSIRGTLIYGLEYNNSRGIDGPEDFVTVLVEDRPLITTIEVYHSHAGTVDREATPTFITIRVGASIQLHLTVHDLSGSGTCTITRNGSFIASRNWTSDTALIIPFNGLDHGDYLFQVTLEDVNGIAGIPYSFTVRVTDAPGDENPWWESPAFYLIAGAAGMATGVVTIVLARKQARRRDLRRINSIVGTIGKAATTQGKMAIKCNNCQIVFNFDKVEAGIEYYCPKCDAPLERIVYCVACGGEIVVDKDEVEKPTTCAKCGPPPAG